MRLFKKSFLILFLIVCAGVSVWTPSNLVQAQASKGSIVALKTDSSGSDGAVISIESTQPIQYTAFKLLNPLRLVLDFPDMEKGNLPGITLVKKGAVESIRSLEFEEAGVLRLEVVLNQSVNYEILKPTANTLSVQLQSEALELAQAGSASSEKTKPEETKDVKKAELEDIKDAATIISEGENSSDDTCYPMLYGKKENISFEFQGADVRSLIRIFAEVSGFNIILSSDLSGTVNMRMNDVPWNEAMEVFLSNNDLGRECLGATIVRIAPQAILATEEAARVAKKAQKAADLAYQRNAQELVTEVVRINNADITELSAALGALRSTRIDARVTVDARTNTIILNDLRKHVDDMLETIRVLDVATPQVLIESKIVELTKTVSQELGVQWGFTGSLAQTNNPNAAILAQSTNATANSNFLVDLGQSTNIESGSVSGFDLTLGSIARGIAVDIQLEALEEEGKARIISSPKVTTADNKEARITSGRQVPYQTVGVNGSAIQFINANLSMTVVPHVTFDRQVYMTIDTTNDDVDFSQQVQNVPTVTTKTTHSEVLVENGDTTVLGGIYTSNVAENKKAVPFFSKIPFLGVLFKSFNESDTLSELLIFVTPTIVDNGYN